MKEVSFIEFYFLYSWVFKSEGGDIAFQITMQNSSGADKSEDQTDIVPKTRVPSHKEIQSGHIFCDPLSTYIIKFDNSFSMMKSKTVIYKCFMDSVSLKSRCPKY